MKMFFEVFLHSNRMFLKFNSFMDKLFLSVGIKTLGIRNITPPPFSILSIFSSRSAWKHGTDSKSNSHRLWLCSIVNQVSISPQIVIDQCPRLVSLMRCVSQLYYDCLDEQNLMFFGTELIKRLIFLAGCLWAWVFRNIFEEF